MKHFLLLAVSLSLTYGDFVLPDIEKYRVLGYAGGYVNPVGEQMNVHGGQRMSEDPTPVGPSDKWQMGESSKMVLALTIARVAAQGFDTEIPLQNVLDFQLGKGFENIIFIQLLTRQSGLPGATDMAVGHLDFFSQLQQETNFDVGVDNRALRHELTEHFLGENAQAYPLTEEESIVNWPIAAHILELVTNKTYEQLVYDEVFDQLGIEGCGFGPNTVDPSLPPSQPWSHIADAFGLYNIPITPSNQAESSTALAPANGLYCDMESFGRLMAVHLERPDDFLPQDAWDIIQNPYYSTAGFGMDFIDLGDDGIMGYSFGYGNAQSSGQSHSAFYIFFKYGFATYTRANALIIPGMRANTGLTMLNDALAAAASGGLVTKLDLNFL
ncbi:uncharacterized protein LOC111695035 [Eurytemora carolleeae]|uniref:uncharacterized protein LOC111695035 n=1 Tax=Eurytemora carolleeae TaxID=1294199 RepID=UPI000C757AEE|nr:uncharacterized protein LOC111695035 [Eurytemora carolleeae]|eukprot:XP_023319946.1 uncharacterized protein LOC111695035 [Eurytemora affinis]